MRFSRISILASAIAGLAACSGGSAESGSTDDAIQTKTNPPQTQNLCAPNEDVIFSCVTDIRDPQHPKNKKVLSVCGSKALTKSDGYLQYRFGTDTLIELRLPDNANKTEFRESVTGGTMEFAGAGAGGAFMRFSNTDDPTVRYTVYTEFLSDGPKGGVENTAGVVVETREDNGGPFSSGTNIKCAREPESNLGPDLFEQAGIAKGEPFDG